MRQLVLFANRNGFHYVLDRETGNFWQRKLSPNTSGRSGWTNEAGRLCLLARLRPMRVSCCTRDQKFEEGKWLLDGRRVFDPKEERSVAIRALELETGYLRRELKLVSPSWAGRLSTDGGLVFGGTDEGRFLALNAERANFCGSSRRDGRFWPIL